MFSTPRMSLVSNKSTSWCIFAFLPDISVDRIHSWLDLLISQPLDRNHALLLPCISAQLRCEEQLDLLQIRALLFFPVGWVYTSDLRRSSLPEDWRSPQSWCYSQYTRDVKEVHLVFLLEDACIMCVTKPDPPKNKQREKGKAGKKRQTRVSLEHHKPGVLQKKGPPPVVDGSTLQCFVEVAGRGTTFPGVS